MVSRFTGRSIIERPACPFCGMPIDRPEELASRMPHEMPLGACGCGAVYACDVTGHNLGTAMIDALVFGCNGDWDLAWNLLPEEDYLEQLVKSYDHESHLIVHSGAYEGRAVSGALYFVRLHQDVREVTEEVFRNELKKAPPKRAGTPAGNRGKSPFIKKDIEALVRDYRMDTLLGMAGEDKRILRALQRLLYSADDLLRLRAAEALGRASAQIARKDPAAISKLLQGFLTSLSDTAASSWGALDAIGEIIGCGPENFAGYIPQLYQLTKDRALRKDVLRALGRIATARPDIIRKTAFRYIPLLKDPDPAVRGYAALLLGNLGAHEAKEALKEIQDDPAELPVYREGELVNRSVGQLACESLGKI